MSAQLPVRDVLTRLEDDAMAAKTTHGSSLSTETILVLERALADAVSANEELDKLKMDGQVSAMFRRPSALRLKQAFIRQAHLQGFQLPEAWQQ